jgi:hypothetical protein
MLPQKSHEIDFGDMRESLYILGSVCKPIAEGIGNEIEQPFNPVLAALGKRYKDLLKNWYITANSTATP